ncbi:MAG: transposase, partial [Oscillospiraceae bacterium]|nr:transposase [Oscillospiraceae bacterium]
MNNLPNRKPNRLPDFDYASPGAYFITFCTRNRECILSRIALVGADIIRPPAAGFEPAQVLVLLTDYGKSVEHAILDIPQHYRSVAVDAYAIMPNHVHLLLRLDAESGRMVSAPTVVGSLKRYISKSLGESIWQKGFYDHVIRNEEDYLIHLQYINENPFKWIMGKDEY